MLVPSLSFILYPKRPNTTTHECYHIRRMLRKRNHERPSSNTSDEDYYHIKNGGSRTLCTILKRQRRRNLCVLLLIVVTVTVTVSSIVQFGSLPWSVDDDVSLLLMVMPTRTDDVESTKSTTASPSGTPKTATRTGFVYQRNNEQMLPTESRTVATTHISRPKNSSSAVRGAGDSPPSPSSSMPPPPLASTPRTQTQTPTQQQKPLCIIHMGPHKTGTTSIQSFLLRQGRELLLQDGYDATMVLGTKNNGGLRAIRKCIKLGLNCSTTTTNPNGVFTKKQREQGQAWKEGMENIVNLGVARGRHLLISDEEFAHFDFEDNADWKVFRTLLQEHYQVHAVLVYRRYFEWLPSYYNQHYKLEGPFRARLNVWPIYEDDRALKRGGIPIPSFAEYWDQRLRNKVTKDRYIALHQWDEQLQLPCHDVGPIRHKLEDQTISVTVLDYHSNTNILIPFLCHGIPNATHACSVAQQSPPKRKNPASTSHDWDRVACHAKRIGGIIPDGFKRRDVLQQLQNYTERTTTTQLPLLPTTCLEGNQLSLFRNISYTAERQIMPSALAAFEDSFARAVSAGKFCNLDVEAAVRNLPWTTILESGVSE